jgi:2,4-dienoyl-CoA reductase-like NADH-dependent reductase (Old Yellow Enzyme family)
MREAAVRFPALFRPLAIRNVVLPNRIAVSAHWAGWFGDAQGLPTDEYVAYLEERARGGIGLFVVGGTDVERNGWSLANADDAAIPRMAALAAAGRRHGVPVFAQFCHHAWYHQPPSKGRLRELRGAFAAAARRAVEGGADGIELHAHESFLHAQLLNPLWNRRADEYGGSLENRLRFIVETLEDMRAAAGTAPLGIRLKLDDVAQRGMGAEDYHEAVARLERTGLLDYVNFTAGDTRHHHGPMPRPDGEWLPLLRDMRLRTRLVVMHAGRITTPEMAEEAVSRGWCDVVCMTKSHICDPHFARKIREGRLDEARFCTRCLQACHGTMDRMGCVYNPLTGRELAWRDTPPASRPRRIVVAGAGPAGLECADWAARRGHRVIVLERAARPGGQAVVGAASPLRAMWGRIADYYARRAARGDFEVRFETEATPDLIRSLAPDAVVVATGSAPVRVALPGGPAAWTVHEALEPGRAAGLRRAVVLDREGSNRPWVAADALSAAGAAVTFVTPFREAGPQVERMFREEMVERLAERGVAFATEEDAAGWAAPGALRLRSTATGAERILEGVEVVVAAAGSVSVNGLADALRGGPFDVHVIGDANIPAGMRDATVQGASLGRRL